MAVTFTREVDRDSAGTGSVPSITVPAGGIPLNAVLVLYYAQNGTTSEIISITDPRGNQWLQIAGSADQDTQIFTTRVTTPYQSGDVIQPTLNGDGSTAKCLLILEFDEPDGDITTSATAATVAVENESGGASVTNTRSAASSEVLLLVSLSIRTDDATFSESGDFTLRPVLRFDGGLQTQSMSLYAAYKIISGGSHTFDGTISSSFRPWWSAHRGVYTAEALIPNVFGGSHPAAKFATPAVVLSSKEGRALYPMVEDLRIIEQANGGQIELSGRVALALVTSRPDIFKRGTEMAVPIRENGSLLGWGEIKQPALGAGIVELTAKGAAQAAETTAKRMFFESRRIADWKPYKARGVGKSPARKLSASQGGAGNVETGVHRYRVTFVSADGETRPGPRTEITVSGSAAQVELSRIPKGPKHVSARRIYRTEAGGSTYGLVTTINNNHATTATDDVADASLGAAPPTSFDSPDISLSSKGSLGFKVSKGSDLADGQLAGHVFDVEGDKITGVAFDIDKSRDTAGFDVRVHKADTDSDFTLRSAISLDEDGAGQAGDSDDGIAIRSGPEVIRVALKRQGTGTGISALKVELNNVIVRGRATDSDYMSSDVVREVCSEAGVVPKYVQESGFPAMPQDWISASHAEILDFNALITGWIWLFFREGNETVCYFGPWGRRKWLLTDPFTDLSGLIPEDPWSAATVAFRWDDGIVVGEVEAIADPNPLEEIVAAPQVFELESRSSRKLAGTLAQRIADFGVARRSAGTFEFSRVQDQNGTWWPAAHVGAGDLLWDPRENVWHRADRLEKSQSGRARCTVPSGVPLFDRFKARRALGRARRGR